MAHPIRLLPVGECFPHQDSEAPDVTLAGELVVVDAFGGVPLHGPLPVGLGLGAERSQVCTCQCTQELGGRSRAEKSLC